MESETRFGLRQHHSYDEVVQYIKADPTRIRFPNRAALFLESHPIYGQLKDALRSYGEAERAHGIYMQGDDMAPFETPRHPMQRPGGGGGGGGGGGRPPPDDDDMMGPPPEPPRNLLEPGVDPTAAGLANNGMQPPPPPVPPPPPANTFAAQVGQAATGFMNTAVGAAANVVGGAMGNAVIQGVGNIVGQGAGLEMGIMGLAAPVAAGVAAASMASALMPVDVPMASFREQRPNDRRNRDQPMRQAAHNTIQGLHNQGLGPAAFVDTRTLNGQNFLKPKDKRLRIWGKQRDDDWQGYTGAIGGASSSSAGLTPAGFTRMPSAKPEPDLPPYAPPSFNDLMGKIKAAPVISVGPRPRERSPRRADNPKRAVGWTRLDPETPGRANALGIRSNVVSLRARRKADRDINPKPTKRVPQPRGGTKRKAEDDINPLVRRPPPKPEGRMKAKKPPKQKPPPPPDVVIKDKLPKPPPPPPPSSTKGKMTSKKSKK